MIAANLMHHFDLSVSVQRQQFADGNVGCSVTGTTINQTVQLLSSVLEGAFSET